MFLPVCVVVWFSRRPSRCLPLFWNSLPGFAAPGRDIFKETVFPQLELLLNKTPTGPSLKMDGTCGCCCLFLSSTICKVGPIA